MTKGRIAKVAGMILMSAGLAAGWAAVSLYRSIYVPPGFGQAPSGLGFVAQYLPGLERGRDSFPISVTTYNRIQARLRERVGLAAAGLVDSQVSVGGKTHAVGLILVTADFLRIAKLSSKRGPASHLTTEQCLVTDRFMAEIGAGGALTMLTGEVCHIAGVLETTTVGFWIPQGSVIAQLRTHPDGTIADERLVGKENASILRALYELPPGLPLSAGQEALPNDRQIRLVPYDEFLFPRSVRDSVSVAARTAGVGLTLVLIACAALIALTVSVQSSEIQTHVVLGASAGRFSRYALFNDLRMHAPYLWLPFGVSIVVFLVASGQQLGIEAFLLAGISVLIALALHVVIFALSATALLLRTIRRTNLRPVRFATTSSLAIIGIQATATILFVVGVSHYSSLRALNTSTLGLHLTNASVIEFIAAGVEPPNTIATVARQLIATANSGLPSVPSAVTLSHPVIDSGFRSSFSIEGRGDFHNSGRVDGPLPPGRKVVSPGFCRVLGCQIVAGRDFDMNDTWGSARVALINQAAQDTYWPGTSPLGQRVKPTYAQDKAQEWAIVVGVVSNIQHEGYRGAVKPELYLSVFNERYGSDRFWMVTASVPTDKLMDRLRDAAVLGLNKFHVRRVTSLEAEASTSVSSISQTTTLFVVVGILGLLSQAVAVLLVASIAAHEKRRELAIRLALGSRLLSVLSVLFRRHMRMAIIAALLGAAGGYWLSEFLASKDPLLVGVTITNAGLLAFAILFLTLSALGAFAQRLTTRQFGDLLRG